MFTPVVSEAVMEAIARSLRLSLCVAMLSGLIGIGAAWLTTRTDLPGGSRLSGLLALPYAIPAYLLGMAWIVLGNPSVGLLKDFLPASGSYGFWGMVFVETSVAFAFPYLELKSGFERMDSCMEEAARMSGARSWRVFRDISLPLLWPSLLNGMCLSFLYTLSSFGVPALLGLPMREFVLTTLIYSQLKVGGSAGLYEGLKLSMILLVIALAVLFASNRILAFHRRRAGAIMGAKASRHSRTRLGALRWPAASAAWGFFFLAVALPWIALGLSALAPVAGNFSPAAWTFKNILYVIQLAEIQEALINSLLLSVITATVVVAGGFLLAFLAVRRGSRLAQAVIELLGLPFATPGTTLAIAVIFVSVWASIWLGLDSTLLWLAVAYALKYSAIGARMMTAGFRQVHPALEEAARISGARTFRLLLDIWAPILRKTLLAAWLLSFLPMLTELAMSVLLTGPGAATLGTILFQLQEYADQPSAAALAWMLLTAALLISMASRQKDMTEGSEP